MYSLTDKRVIESLCKRYGFRMKRGLGQNFLNDENVLISIAGAVSAPEVIEIGPGFGVLTAALASKAEKVVALEIDSALLPVLSETLSGFNNVEIINEDVMKCDIHALIKERFTSKNISVAANLPYYITTPIIMKLLEERLPLREIVIMVQKEVADRIMASPGTKDYGALTLAVNYYCSAEKICDVPRSAFTPQPNVDSTVLKLNVLDSPSVEVFDEKLFFALVRASFAQRRKTLLNGLRNSGQFGNKEAIEAAMQEAQIDVMARGETLSKERFAELANIFYKIRKK